MVVRTRGEALRFSSDRVFAQSLLSESGVAVVIRRREPSRCYSPHVAAGSPRGIRTDSTVGLLALGVAFVGFGVFRLVNDERIGWLLLAAGVLAVASAWWKIGRPPEG